MSDIKRFDFDTDEACTRIRFGEMANGMYALFSDIELLMVQAENDREANTAIRAERDQLRKDLDTEAANHAETLAKLAEMDQELLKSNAAHDVASDHQLELNTTIFRLERQANHLRERRRYWIAESCKVERQLGEAREQNASLLDAMNRIHFRCESFAEGDRDMRVASVEVVRDIAARAIKVAGPKVCVECDQPYCHGVCVERGDDKEPTE